MCVVDWRHRKRGVSVARHLPKCPPPSLPLLRCSRSHLSFPREDTVSAADGPSGTPSRDRQESRRQAVQCAPLTLARECMGERCERCFDDQTSISLYARARTCSPAAFLFLSRTSLSCPAKREEGEQILRKRKREHSSCGLLCVCMNTVGRRLLTRESVSRVISF